jgi:hypothetical protein
MLSNVEICRACKGTLGNLVAGRLITSSKMLAALVPGLVTSEAASVGFEDLVLRRLINVVQHVAFRLRRLLLLFNLEHQVRLAELPWAAAATIQHRCTNDAAGRSASRRTLELIVKEALCGFPQTTVLPNKLPQSCRELATDTEMMDLPLVDELPTDIFEGGGSR